MIELFLLNFSFRKLNDEIHWIDFYVLLWVIFIHGHWTTFRLDKSPRHILIVVVKVKQLHVKFSSFFFNDSIEIY